MIPAIAAKAIPFLRAYWKEFAIGGVILALAFGFWLRGVQLDAEKAAHKLTKAAFEQQVSDYRAAYDKARADAVEAARKVETEQERITHEVSADYQARLADVRARYSRLLAEARADSSHAGEADLPGVPNTASGADDPASHCGLSLETRLVASEQAIQLQALQDWLRGQVAVER